MSDDPYVYPGTDVLRNDLGIRDPDELRRVESDLTYWRALRLATAPIPGSYDLAHLQACHRALFGGLYAWAGQLRTVRITKSDVFCLPQFIESSAYEIFARLTREQHLVGLARDEFIDSLATYLPRRRQRAPSVSRRQRPRPTRLLRTARQRRRLPPALAARGR